MKKALELLKELKKESVKRWYQNHIDEAIEELEELKYCYLCNYVSIKDIKNNQYLYICCNLKVPTNFVSKDFCCNKFEPKKETK